MTCVARILAGKSDGTLHSIHPEASLTDAARLMLEHGIGALLVLDHDEVVGIVTERDYLRHAADSVTPAQAQVRDIMRSPVRFVRPEQTIEECMVLMTECRFRHLPVRNGWGSVVGMVSIGDLVKDIIGDQQFTIQQLQRYIAG